MTQNKWLSLSWREVCALFILLFFKVNSALAIMFLVPEAWQPLFVWKPKGLAGLATDRVSLSWDVLVLSGSGGQRKVNMQSQGRCWISSRNVIPDALPGYRWVFRFLVMELAYQRFYFDRACILPDPPSNWHTRIVVITSYLCKTGAGDSDTENHRVISDPQILHSLQR